MTEVNAARRTLDDAPFQESLEFSRGEITRSRDGSCRSSWYQTVGHYLRCPTVCHTLPRQLRDPSRCPWRAALVHLFLDRCEIDFDQLVQAVEERTGLLLRDCERFAMRRRRRGSGRESVDRGVHAIEQRRESGFVGAAIIYLFLTRVLMSAEEDMDPTDYEMVGVLGRISSSIREGGTGEIIYSQAGTRRTCGARAEDGSAISKGIEIIVTRYEKGIAYVRLWTEMAGEDSVMTVESDGKGSA